MSLNELFDIKRLQKSIYYLVGFILVSSGIIIGFYGTGNWDSILVGWGSIIASLGIAVIAFGISKKSQIVIKKSEKMNRAIVKSAINEAVGMFEDKRLNLRAKYYKINEKIKLENSNIRFRGRYAHQWEYYVDLLDFRINYSFSIWKCKTYLVDMACKFEDFFTLKDEKWILHHVDNLFMDLCESKVLYGELQKDNIKHLKQIYEKITKFNLFEPNFYDVSCIERSHRIDTNYKYLNKSSPIWLTF